MTVSYFTKKCFSLAKAFLELKPQNCRHEVKAHWYLRWQLQIAAIN